MGAPAISLSHTETPVGNRCHRGTPADSRCRTETPSENRGSTSSVDGSRGHRITSMDWEELGERILRAARVAAVMHLIELRMKGEKCGMQNEKTSIDPAIGRRQVGDSG